MQNSLRPPQLHFSRGSPVGDNDMVMIATHNCVFWMLLECGQNPDSDSVVRQDNQSQLTIMQW